MQCQKVKALQEVVEDQTGYYKNIINMTRRNITPFDMILMNQKELINETKLNTQILSDQNKLLQTRLEIQNHINSAREIKKNIGPKSSPKKRGGQIK